MKTYEQKNVFSWSNATDAISYIQNKGYFGDSTKELENNISKNKINVLTSVDIGDAIRCFKTNTPDEFEYALFIPFDKVKEIEEPKKYRPFKTIQEFKNTLCGIDFNEPIQLRYKNNHNNSIMTIFTGYEELNNELIAICLGACILVPENGFNDFEVYNNKTEEWQPFGMEKK